VMREKYGEKVRLRVVGERGSWLRRWLGLPDTRAAAATGLDDLPERLIAAGEERLMWSRYGL